MNNKKNLESVSCDLFGLRATIYRNDDGVLSVLLDTQDCEGRDVNPDGSPRVNIWVNDALICKDGE